MSEKPEAEEIPGLIIDEEGTQEVLIFAVNGLTDIFAAVPDEDLDDTTVTVNAGKMADCLELLLLYAEVYEDLNVEQLVEQAEIERQMGSYQPHSNLIH